MHVGWNMSVDGRLWVLHLATISSQPGIAAGTQLSPKRNFTFFPVLGKWRSRTSISRTNPSFVYRSSLSLTLALSFSYSQQHIHKKETFSTHKQILWTAIAITPRTQARMNMVCNTTGCIAGTSHHADSKAPLIHKLKRENIVLHKIYRPWPFFHHNKDERVNKTHLILSPNISWELQDMLLQNCSLHRTEGHCYMINTVHKAAGHNLFPPKQPQKKFLFQRPNKLTCRHISEHDLIHVWSSMVLHFNFSLEKAGN